MKRWRIPKFPGYAVSEDGRVWTRKNMGPNGDSRPFQKSYREKKPASNYGYLYVILQYKKRQYGKRVHRLVLETFVGPCPNGMEACHKDGNRTNNNLSNLRWGTPTENQKDRVRHGTDNRGERHGCAKLTEGDVRKIRLLRTKGWTLQKIADLYQMTDMAIHKIVTGKTWSHVH